MVVKYRLEQIQQVLALLDGVTIKGVDSASKVVQIMQTLNSPVSKDETEEE